MTYEERKILQRDDENRSIRSDLRPEVHDLSHSDGPRQTQRGET